jgi:hypothetical protein
VLRVSAKTKRCGWRGDFVSYQHRRLTHTAASTPSHPNARCRSPSTMSSCRASQSSRCVAHLAPPSRCYLFSSRCCLFSSRRYLFSSRRCLFSSCCCTFSSRLLSARRLHVCTLTFEAHPPHRILSSPRPTAALCHVLSKSPRAQPVTPLALRTSGHLLLGVVRIHDGKAKDLMMDCSNALCQVGDDPPHTPTHTHTQHTQQDPHHYILSASTIGRC